MAATTVSRQATTRWATAGQEPLSDEVPISAEVYYMSPTDYSNLK